MARKFEAEYWSWSSMKQRCYNPKAKSYEVYGGRGIGVSDSWRNDFKQFVRDMGLRPTPQHTLERLDSNKDYSVDNCKWATPKEQANNRRTNRIIEFRGERLSVAAWAVKLNLNENTLRARLDSPTYTIESALTNPVQTQYARH